MSLDALISYVEETDEGLRIELCPRILPSGNLSISGREEMIIVTPVDIDLIHAVVWGSASRVEIIPRNQRGRWFKRNGMYLEEVGNDD